MPWAKIAFGGDTPLTQFVAFHRLFASWFAFGGRPETELTALYADTISGAPITVFLSPAAVDWYRNNAPNFSLADCERPDSASVMLLTGTSLASDTRFMELSEAERERIKRGSALMPKTSDAQYWHVRDVRLAAA